ncbi:Xaa-Pro dipeptidyl-peptidase [Jannaschia sp. R86511]|uniref:Xaa-Pro dipeptidyl-peptidase n=1 Tax=Jannaschia sp. R86511 TaxID=3093853 RepID=UPI0036D29BCE
MARTHRRALTVAIATTSALALTLPMGAASATTPAPQDPPGIEVRDGLTQPIHDFAAAITERVWVETDLDTDSDGVLDRVLVDLSRPAPTADGLEVPVVLEASPYRSGTWGDAPYHTDLDPTRLPQSRFATPAAALRSQSFSVLSAQPKAVDLPGSLDNYYVPRGYGVVLAQSIGTGQSTGCPTTGDDAETRSAKAVVDWLDGRARAFDAVEGGAEVEAGWTNGAVGMTGASYNGTIPNQLATYGDEVPNLKTIVPVVAISDWYGYYRENGLVVAPGGYQGEDAEVLADFVAGEARATGECADEIARIEVEQDRVTGDYNDFWDDRNHLDGADDVTASVFVVDGRNDWNVKPLQWSRWWDALAEAGVERKIWLHNGGHGTPGNAAAYTLADGQRWTYQQTVHRWFDHELWGVDNGIMTEPRAIVQREAAGVGNVTYADWPVPGSADVRLSLNATSATAPGGLGSTRARSVEQSFTDDGRNRNGTSLIAGPDTADDNRLGYTTDPLSAPVHLSGTPSVDLFGSVDNDDAANLTAYLVDYSPTGAATMVTRGWMDVQNRQSRGWTSAVTPGRDYRLRWDLHPDDYVFAPGHRVGLVVFSTDRDFTLRPDPGTRLSLQPGSSTLTLPVVGGTLAP